MTKYGVRQFYPLAIRRGVLAAALLLRFGSILGAQSTATVTGVAIDSTGAAIAGVELVIARDGVIGPRKTSSSADGTFSFAGLAPGSYSLRASARNFATAEFSLILNVDDRVSIKVELKVASIDERVTVESAPSRINTASSVSTVIDRQFVENLPLNGRSLQSLLELTPGVVLTPVAPTGGLEGGQFSVNGQRANANYLTVDGVGANVGVTPTGSAVLPSQGGSGQLPAFNAVGGTQGLVSVDALQEFRIQTSSYAPEFGRTPGGQISMVTRSGTNVMHGTGFGYFRHEAMDAKDWFVNNKGLPKPRTRQQQFGGVFGGPLWRDRTFFFGSYEGLRLKEPRALATSVPSLSLRETAAPEVRALVNLAPLPNGTDFGNGTAEFAASWSNSSRFDSSSVRMDHRIGVMSMFGRFSHAPSLTQPRSGNLSYLTTTKQETRTVTVGSTAAPVSWLVHDLRVNHTMSRAPTTYDVDGFGGAQIPPLSVFGPGAGPDSDVLTVTLSGLPGDFRWGSATNYLQRQINIVDSATISLSKHQFKLGMDFRRLTPEFDSYSRAASVVLTPAGLATAQTRTVQLTFRDTEPARVVFNNLSLYAQDTWRPASRVTLTYGIRWELVPPPHSADGEGPVTLNNLDEPYGGSVSLAQRGTPLWKTRHDNIAPRLGASYILSDRQGGEFVVRAGGGTFHDLGYGLVASAFTTWPFLAMRSGAPTYPPPPEFFSRPQLGADSPTLLVVVDRALVLPRTYQWNLSADRSLGAHHALTVSYVGAQGRDLLKSNRYRINLVGYSALSNITSTENNGYSDYRAFQLQFQRRQHRGAQYVLSYTFGRARDTASSDALSDTPAERVSPALDYGYSDFDVRHVMTAAMTLQMPRRSGHSLWSRASDGWGLDLVARIRSGSPLAVKTSVAFPPEVYSARPNVVAGEPFWVDDDTVPGGRRLNRAAFTIPPANTQGDLVRGSVRGFSTQQLDLALRRDVRINDTVRLQFRIDSFNILNTPQFFDPTGVLELSSFGVAGQTRNAGFGGLNSLYQMGGPRSTQLAVKLIF